MEKEPQPDSMAAVTIKPEYAPSEAYSTEPPPVRGKPWGIDLAYHKPRDSAVQIAKIIAVTVVLCSVVLGGFLLASAYVTANASCRQLEQELELLSEAADRFQAPVPQPEALVQEEPVQSKRHIDVLQNDESKSNAKEIETNSIDEPEINSDGSESSSESSAESDEEERTPIHIKLPLQLDLDDLAGAILDKNQKSKMNCIVEKKKAEEVVDHQPKTIRLPFGLNLTTDPRFERLSGERMVIICESGSFQGSQPQPQSHENDEDQDEDTIMIQPVMIPIPHTPFQTHMPQQMPPPQRIQMMPPQQRAPMMPPPAVQMVFEQGMPMRPPMRPPMHPMETMRPPMPPMMQPQVQIIQPQSQSQTQGQPQPQGEFPPNTVLHHIIQQIIAQKVMESQRARAEQMRQIQQQQMQQQQQQQQSQQVEIQQHPQQVEIRPHLQQVEIRAHPQQVEIQQQVGVQQPRQETTQAQETDEPDIPMKFQMMHRLPIPEEVLTQLNRLPNRNVIVAVSESDSSEENPQEVRFVQEQRQNAAEMNGRQAFARRLPVDIPVAMMPQQESEPESQEGQAAASEETRPHYVHPRSVRSVGNPFKDQKRVKRCACDCAC